MNLEAYLEAHRPMNWAEYGSSAKDLCDERLTRSYFRTYGVA